MCSRCCPARCRKHELERRLADADAAVVMKLGRHLPKVRRALDRAGRLDARHLCGARHHRGRRDDAARRQAGRCRALFCDRAGAGLGGPGARVAHERTARRGRAWARRCPLSDAAGAGRRSAAAERSTAMAPYLDRVPVRPGQARHASDNRRGRRARRRGAAPCRRRAPASPWCRAAIPASLPWRPRCARRSKAGPDAWRALDLAIVPGVTAMLAVAARVGAPLGHDFCALSLSDNLKPWELDRAAARCGGRRRLRDRALQSGLARAALAARRAPSSGCAGICRRRRRWCSAARSAAPTERVTVTTLAAADRNRRRHGDARHRRLARDARDCAARAGRRSSTRPRSAQGAHRMIDPARPHPRPLDRRRHRGQRRPAQHDDRQAERARRRDLAVGRGRRRCSCATTTRCGAPSSSALIVRFAERTAPGDIDACGTAQRRLDRIDAADQIVVLRRRGERRDAPGGRARERRGAALRRAPRTASLASATSVQRSPAIGDPGRPPQRQQRHACCGGRAGRIGGDCRRIGMRRVDQRIDAFGRADKRASPSAPPKPPTRTGTGCAAGAAVRPASDSVTARSARAARLSGQLPRLRGAAENEDASHVAR